MLIVILTWLVFGLIVGLLARAVFPGPQPMSLLGTIGLGVAGSLVGGTIANVFFGGRVFALHWAGFLGSFLGALVILALMAAANRSRTVT